MKIFKNKKLRKTLALGFILNILNLSFFPTISWALTAGPTAPEATSFEPVDTSDMVNLQSGDFNYTIPLLEVPGPAGGYPLSLSYHSGIRPGVEASWVGLGWTLNPGAINRFVNGHPDDHDGEVIANRSFWEGGVSETYSIGVTVGIPYGPGVMAGVEFANDTYKGSGTGYYTGLSFSKGIGGKNSPFSAGASIKVGVSPYGESYVSGGIGIGAGLGKSEKQSGSSGLSLGGGIGFSTRGGGGFGAGVGLSLGNDKTSQSLLGASISSSQGGLKGGFSLGGGSASTINNKSNKISTSTKSFGIDVPVAPMVSISLGHSKTRYWIDETERGITHGTLYTHANREEDEDHELLNDYNNQVYDSHDLLEINEEIAEERHAAKMLGGTFPSYDNYQVMAQGISGSIRPFLFEKTLYRQNYEDSSVYQAYSFHDINRPVEFRFLNDFSNKLKTNPDQLQYNEQNQLYRYNAGLGQENGVMVNNQLASSRHVEWYTNAQILGENEDKHPFSEGFIENRATGFDRRTAPSHQVGGFKITNPSGVTYHFTLPVYAFEEYSKSENIDTAPAAGGEAFNSQHKPDKYAYTWYLTAITGPDFIDSGENDIPNGILDQNDKGYWVKFNYGKWTDEYLWRNPGEGYHKDIDDNIQSHSRGKKELYYLDYIQTASHTAIFEKSIRADAKGVSHPVIGGFTTSSTGEDRCQIPTCTLKLDKIYLLDNDLIEINIDEIKNADSDSTYYHVTYDNSTELNGEEVFNYSDLHLGQNIIDIYDIPSIDGIMRNSCRIIELETDYSLCSKTANSFLNHDDAMFFDATNNNPFDPGIDFNQVFEDLFPVDLGFGPINNNDRSPYNHIRDGLCGFVGFERKLGKLTLNSVKYYGKSGVNIIPPIQFSYDYTNPQTLSGTIQEIRDREDIEIPIDFINHKIYSLEASSGSAFDPGEIFKIRIAENNIKHGVCLLNQSNETFFTFLEEFEQENPPPNRVFCTATKNPPYLKDHKDIWGMFKSDYVPYYNPDSTINQNISGEVTAISSKSTDAWSLRSIKTSLGAEIQINYQSDTYRETPLEGYNLLAISDMEIIDPETHTLKLTPLRKNGSLDIGEFEMGDEIAFIGSYGFAGTELIDSTFFNVFGEVVNEMVPVPIYESEIFNEPLEVLSVDEGSFIVRNESIARSFDNHVPCVNENECNIELLDQPPLFLGGYISFSDTSIRKKGGGIRTSKIALRDPFTKRESATEYAYTNGVTSYQPLNLHQTYFHNFLNEEELEEYYNRETWLENAETSFRREINQNFSKILAYARHAPAPGVMYATTTVKEKAIDASGNEEYYPNYTQYEFEVFKDEMVQIESLQEANDEEISIQRFLTPLERERYPFLLADQMLEHTVSITKKAKVLALRDMTSRIGNLKRVTLFTNDNQKISEKTNYYLHDQVDFEQEDSYQNYLTSLSDFNHQGTIQETFFNDRFLVDHVRPSIVYPPVGGQQIPTVRGSSMEGEHLAIASRLELYPSIPLGQTSTDYRTGITTTTQNLAFDFYSGLPTKTIATDAYGKKYLSVNTPAYTITSQEGETAYPTMGLKTLDPANKHMLTQEAQSYTFLGEEVDYEKVMVASIQTWNDDWKYREWREGNYEERLEPVDANKIWRKHQTFHWNGTQTNTNGTYQNFQPFQWANINANEANLLVEQNPFWQEVSEITRYDYFSHALEAKDINGNYAATKMDSRSYQIYATAAPSKYTEFAYAGGEDQPDANGYLGGEVHIGDGEIIEEAIQGFQIADPAHTGVKTLQVPAQSRGYNFRVITNNENRPKRYRVSVWTTNAENTRIFTETNQGNTEEIEGVTRSVGFNRLGVVGMGYRWYQINKDVVIPPGSNVLIGCQNIGNSEINLDDFRVHPIEASMKSYVYDPLTNDLTHILNDENLYTRFEYDAEGRLRAVYQETFQDGGQEKLISRNNYHYAREER